MQHFAKPAPIAFDVGMNNGDDSAYYLAKGMNVVAIDANPSACARARKRFAAEIAADRIRIFNVGVSDVEQRASFYVNEKEDALSTFLPERFRDVPWVRQVWTRHDVEVRRLSGLIEETGAPEYVKIDVEFLDAKVVADLAAANIRPPYLSVELQEVAPFETLRSMGYRRFQLVEGESVHLRFLHARVRRTDGSDIVWSFPRYSTGPFGADLGDGWTGEAEVREALSVRGPGWIDVHAWA